VADGLRILVVDDNPMSRELAQDVLVDAGHEVRPAAGVEEALEAVAAFAPAVVLLDWHLKGATGADVLAVVRARDAPGRKPVRVVVVTADIRPELRAAAIAAGADALVTKPYRASQLLSAIDGAPDGDGGGASR